MKRKCARCARKFLSGRGNAAPASGAGYPLTLFGRHGDRCGDRFAQQAACCDTALDSAFTAHSRFTIGAVTALKDAATLLRILLVLTGRIVERPAPRFAEGVACFLTAGGSVLIRLAAVANGHFLPEARLRTA